MENPGLKRYDPPVRVIQRRTADYVDNGTAGRGGAPLPSSLDPSPMNGVVPLYHTDHESVEEAPPAYDGTHITAPVGADNGDHGMGPMKMVQGAAPLPAPDSNAAADQRRIEQQQQIGGGRVENPAYDAAQERIQQMMQQRMGHPLHQAAKGWDDDLHGPEDMLQFENEFGPHGQHDPHRDIVYDEHEFHVPETMKNPLVDDYAMPIHHVDPWSPQYDADYKRGWAASREYAENGDRYHSGELGDAPLDKLDDSNASHAAYDGYYDDAAGRRPYTLRAARRLGLDSPEDLSDEDWENPHLAGGGKESDLHGHDWFGSYGHTASVQKQSVIIERPSGAEGWRNFIDTDFRPENEGDVDNHTDQPMIDLKHDYRDDYPDILLEPGNHHPGSVCETCYLKHGDMWSGFDQKDHETDYGHPFKPADMEPNQRYSSHPYENLPNPGILRQQQRDTPQTPRAPRDPRDRYGRGSDG